MALRRVLPLVVVFVALMPTTAKADDIESQVFALINAGRSTPLILHHGLLQDAEGHSQYMAQTGSLNHDNAQERVDSAPPDPPQANPPPDDGFAPAGWCENATYVVPAQGDPAHAIYNNWKNSPPHAACMNNTGKNVGAVGVYWDGSTWWATFVADQDSTPPGGAQTTDVTNPSDPTKMTPHMPSGVYTPPLPAPAAATAAPVHYDYAPISHAAPASASPSPSPPPPQATPIAQPNSLLVPTSVDTSASSESNGLGMPELAALVAVLVLGCLFLERRLYVPAEFAWRDDDVPREQFALSTLD